VNLGDDFTENCFLSRGVFAPAGFLSFIKIFSQRCLIVTELVFNSSAGQSRIITESEHHPRRNNPGVIGTGIENLFLGFQGGLNTIKKPSISDGERKHFNARAHPVSDATRHKGRGRLDVLSRGPSR
jgi:hypothetical protein